MNFAEYAELLTADPPRPDVKLLHQGLDMLDHTASKSAAQAGVSLADFAAAAEYAYARRLAQTWYTARRAQGVPTPGIELADFVRGVLAEVIVTHTRALAGAVTSRMNGGGHLEEVEKEEGEA